MAGISSFYRTKKDLHVHAGPMKPLLQRLHRVNKRIHVCIRRGPGGTHAQRHMGFIHALDELQPEILAQNVRLLVGEDREQLIGGGIHLQLEAIKLAFADARQYVSDPRNMKVSVEQLLSEDFAAQRRELITDKAQVYAHGIPRGSDTVYLCTADNEGNMVSYIQSNYAGFGSGIVVPGTGVSLQNRGSSFNLDPGHVNALAPSKRPYHTIIPGFIMKDGLPVGPFGLMGGFMQPQGHVQMIMNMFDFGLDVQESLDAPRWQWMEENSSILEPDVPIHVYEGLKAMGHDIKYVPTVGSFGRGQSIFRHKDALMGATEPRTDGGCIAY